MIPALVLNCTHVYPCLSFDRLHLVYAIRPHPLHRHRLLEEGKRPLTVTTALAEPARVHISIRHALDGKAVRAAELKRARAYHTASGPQATPPVRQAVHHFALVPRLAVGI